VRDTPTFDAEARECQPTYLVEAGSPLGLIVRHPLPFSSIMFEEGRRKSNALLGAFVAQPLDHTADHTADESAQQGQP